MHVLITGGAGFIGSHLAELHLRQGHQVHVVDDLSTGRLANVEPFLESPKFRFQEADVLVWDGLDKTVAWADRIYHMAALVGMRRVLAEPTRVLAINIAGTERLLRAVQNGGWHPQILLASTSEVYGTQAEAGQDPASFDEGAMLSFSTGVLSRQNYALSKLVDENLGLAFAKKFGLRVVIARLFNTIGPRQRGRYGMVVPNFVRKAVEGDPITVFGDGTQRRSFIDVRDTVRALDLLAGTASSSPEIVNVGRDRDISILDLAKMVKERAGSASPIEFIPYEEAYGEPFEDCRFRRPVLERLRRITGFEARIPLEQTLDELIRAERALVHLDSLRSLAS